MNNKLLGLIDATVHYPELEKLTLHRQATALPYGAKYRIIDFALSNMMHSGIRNVAVFPSGNFRSLVDHVGAGKIWGLDRNRDGLFILPPKKTMETEDTIIPFIRLREHNEFLLRSRQKYVVFTQGNIVWNIDFNDVLESHIQSGADITEVVHKGLQLKTYLLETKRLISYISQFETLNLKNLMEVSNFDYLIKKNIYEFTGYTRVIDNIKSFYKGNMDFLKRHVVKELVLNDRPIYTKDRPIPPVKYRKSSYVFNSIIANGCDVNGTVENSVISPFVEIADGTIIKNSIISQGSIIGKNAYLDGVILDKNSQVSEGAILKSQNGELIVKEKNAKVANENKINVMHVAAEAVPYIKTGGLADVAGALTKELKGKEVETVLVIPMYKKVEQKFKDKLTNFCMFDILYKDEIIDVEAFTSTENGVLTYLLKVGEFFDREECYGYEDDNIRFMLFNIAVLELVEQLKRKPNIIHTHDWHTGLIPLFYKKYYKDLYNSQNIRTAHTIHNLKYQGDFTYDDYLNIKDNFEHNNMDCFTPTVKHYNFMELALLNATKITTVSKTYRDEIQYAYFGFGLDGVLRKRNKDLVGIINGIDVQKYDPSTDDVIAQKYRLDTVGGKKINKENLQKELGLEVDENIPIVAMVTRIADMKGIELVISVLDKLMESENVQFVLLGTGDEEYEIKLKEFEHRYPNKVSMNLGYYAYEANKIYAGADMFLIPSKFEPCGLTQMIALRYGTLPIVRETGGLYDVINSYNEFTGEGNGFSFKNYNAYDMLHTIRRAITFYNDDNVWSNLIKSAMQTELSWNKSIKEYVALYQDLLEK